MSASTYARGGTVYNSLEAQYGTAIADKQWQDAITAEKNGINVDGAWRAQKLAELTGKNGEKADESFWSNLGRNLYNDPLAAPLEQGNRIAGNTITAALKNPFASIGIALAVGGVAFALWLYLKPKK